MTNASLLSPIEAVLTQSQALLDLAKEEDWEAFDVLLQQRQAGMKTLTEAEYLKALTEAGLDTSAKSIVNQVLEINKELGHLALNKQERIATEIRQSLLAEKATAAYGQ